MKKRRKYFDGPSGIYYDGRNDRIFAVRSTGLLVWDDRVKDINGKLYDVYMTKAMRPTFKGVSIFSMDDPEVIKLDDLPRGWK